MSAFRNAVFNDYHKTQRGENGCVEYTDRGVGSNILALSQMVRGGQPQSLAKEVLASGSTQETEQLALLIFATRNTRGGKGEKKLSYDLFCSFRSAYPQTAVKLLSLFPLYGYWKDIFLIMEMEKDHLDSKSGIIDAAYPLIKEQWDKDLAALALYKQVLQSTDCDAEQKAKIKKTGPKISLLAKWLPREGKSLDKKLGFVQHFARLVYGEDLPKTSTTPVEVGGDDSSCCWKSSAKTRYRKQVVELTSFLALPEVLLAAQKADEINIQRVASKATKLLTNAFLNESCSGELRSRDPKRLRLREIFIDAIAQQGLKGGQVMPHEIVAAARQPGLSRAKELALDAQWKDLWKTVVTQVKATAAKEGIEFDPTRMVPLCDVSGSMEGTPMDVSIALGIGISEITHPTFRDMVLTFCSTPTWHRLPPEATIVEKVRSLEKAPWGTSTDFVKAYDLILEVCRNNKLKREDLPCLIVFSDMQFDEAHCGDYYYHPCGDHGGETMFRQIRRRVEDTAKVLGWDDKEPTPIVFWNLRNTGGHPVDKDTKGAVLLSGFSPSLLKLVMNGQALKEEEVEVVQEDGTVIKEKIRVTPEQLLKKMLDDSLYDPVREILGASTEGALREYEWIPSNGEDLAQKSLEQIEDDFELI